MRTRLFPTLALLLVACGGSTNTPTQPSASDIAGELQSVHFTFRYTRLDAGNVATTADRVEREYNRILADLGADTMPIVRVTFYTEHAALEAATRAVAGVVPPWTAGLVTAQDQIHLMSPNLPQWGTYDRMISHIVHEFAHCVSLHLNPRFANNPRWLWEAIAIYESGQFVDPRTLAYMTAHRPPAFDQLSSFENTLVYDVGYTIAEFIVAEWGQARLGDLIQSNGELASTLGIAQAEFERRWFLFVQERYGI